jgi:PAT family beta-lactamase induction signal transducer AmpG
MESHIGCTMPQTSGGTAVHGRLCHMQPTEPGVADREIHSQPHERPWLFGLLTAPAAVISIGLIGGSLSYLLRKEGVDPSRSGTLIALLTLPHVIYFLWAPITDFFIRRRTWLMAASVAASLALLAAFSQPRLASPLAVRLMFLCACFGVFVVAACGGMMGSLQTELNRRRASGFYQSGSLAFGAVAVFAVVSLASYLTIRSLGFSIAAMIVTPALFALAAPAQNMIREHGLAETRSRVWHEFRQTFLRWEAIPYTLLVTAPFCSGALIGLLPGLAVDYGVSGQQVAWINGFGGALLTIAGASSTSLIPIRIRAPIAFLLAGLLNAGAMAVIAVGPQRPATYFTGTVLFLFTIGAGYALFTGVVLEFLGGSGKSGSSRYAIINSLGNLPVAYVAYLDGRAYAHWGPRAMPAADAVLSAIGATVLMAHFVFSRRRRPENQSLHATRG